LVTKSECFRFSTSHIELKCYLRNPHRLVIPLDSIHRPLRLPSTSVVDNAQEPYSRFRIPTNPSQTPKVLKRAYLTHHKTERLSSSEGNESCPRCRRDDRKGQTRGMKKNCSAVSFFQSSLSFHHHGNISSSSSSFDTLSCASLQSREYYEVKRLEQLDSSARFFAKPSENLSSFPCKRMKTLSNTISIVFALFASALTLYSV